MTRSELFNRGEQGGLVRDALRTVVVGLTWSAEWFAAQVSRPFGREGARPGVPAEAANEAASTSAPVGAGPHTLVELGVDGGLARDLELTFRALGATRGDRVVGYEFVTLDGATHELRLAGGDRDRGARPRAA